jgi:hypothetical protein
MTSCFNLSHSHVTKMFTKNNKTRWPLERVYEKHARRYFEHPQKHLIGFKTTPNLF